MACSGVICSHATLGGVGRKVNSSAAVALPDLWRGQTAKPRATVRGVFHQPRDCGPVRFSLEVVEGSVDARSDVAHQRPLEVESENADCGVADLFA